MNKKIGRIALGLCLVVMLAAAFPLTACAEDIIIHVPITFSNIPQAFWGKLQLEVRVFDANNQLIIWGYRPLSDWLSANNGNWSGEYVFKFNYPANNPNLAKSYSANIVAITGDLPPHDPASVTSRSAAIPAN